MSDTMIGALIGAGVTLIVTVVTLITNALIVKYKSKLEIQQRKNQTKIEHLNKVYTELLTIINIYPDSSPNDVLKHVEYAPNYFMESFDAILMSLDYQIEDYKKQLENTNIDYERKSDIRVQISNREYSKKEISEIRDKYFLARDKYKSFCESEKAVFELYAGKNARYYLDVLNMVIDNVFISGRCAGDANDPLNNNIIIARRNLIDAIRNDLGTY